MNEKQEQGIYKAPPASPICQKWLTAVETGPGVESPSVSHLLPVTTAIPNTSFCLDIGTGALHP